MVRDRGRIKWNAMMLPEHVKLLKEYHADFKKVEKPVLDEQKYEEFNAILFKAINEGLILTLTYYDKGEMKQSTGEIQKINSITQEIHLNHDKLSLNDILEIEECPK